MNHAAEACKQAEKDRREMEQRNKKETASTVTLSGTDPSDEEETNKDHFAYTVSRRSSLATDRAWYIMLDIHGRGLKSKVDTGAKCNILPHQAYKALCKHPQSDRRYSMGQPHCARNQTRIGQASNLHGSPCLKQGDTKRTLPDQDARRDICKSGRHQILQHTRYYRRFSASRSR